MSEFLRNDLVYRLLKNHMEHRYLRQIKSWYGGYGMFDRFKCKLLADLDYQATVYSDMLDSRGEVFDEAFKQVSKTTCLSDIEALNIPKLYSNNIPRTFETFKDFLGWLLKD